MKKLVVSLFVMSAFVAVSAQACIQEAQFIGQVKNYSEIQKSASIKECFYQIEFSMFNESYVCPLSIGEVSYLTHQDRSCSLKNGVQVSGILTKSEDGRVVIE